MYSFRILFAIAVLLASSQPSSGRAERETTAPLVIPASEYFEGNDGPWSTFDLRVGTPEQYMRVVVSTASPHSLVPFQEACSTAVFKTVPPDCAVSRGNLFDQNQSSTWNDVGLYGINQNGVGLEANLGYEARVEFGLDKVAIGLTGPGFANQTVGGIAATVPFYLGILGINPQPLNFSSLGNHSVPSLFTTLKDKRKTPSLSWSYTAGAKYRLKEVYGQLIFGGYDSSRFTENSVSFSMADDITRDLVVSLQSISYNGANSATLLSTPINIMIDSTDPNLWLPSDVCDAFEKAFGLVLDHDSGLYLVNDTYHNALLDANPRVSFRLSDVTGGGGDTVVVVLPYAAFDLTAEAPLVKNTSHYFPLKRANDSGQYTLGRTFLQEAYLSVDYERKVFNVSACTWNQGAEQNIITITSKDLDPSTPGGGGDGDGDGQSSSGTHGLSPGVIAGIVVGSVAGALLIAAVVAVIVLRNRRKWLGRGFAAAAKHSPADNSSVLDGPVFNSSLPPPESHSTPDSSGVPYSAADVSGSVSGSRSTGESDMSEVDQNGTRRPLPAVAENPSGVYELPGTIPARGAPPNSNADRPAEIMDREPSSVGDASLSSDDVANGRKHSPPSPLTAASEKNPPFGRQSMVSNQ